MLGGLILANMLMLGNYDNGVMQKVTAGISGIYNDDSDVAFWGGGTLQQAIALVTKFKQNPRYSPTEDEWSNFAKFVITHGGMSIQKGGIFADFGYFKGLVSIADGKILLDVDGSGHLANGNISWGKDGKPVFKGKITTASDGRRIEMDAETNSFRMYNADDKILFDIQYVEQEGTMSYPRIIMNSYDKNGDLDSQSWVGSSNIAVTSFPNKMRTTITPSALQIFKNYNDIDNNENILLRYDGLFIYKNGKLTKSYN